GRVWHFLRKRAALLRGGRRGLRASDFQCTFRQSSPSLFECSWKVSPRTRGRKRMSFLHPWMLLGTTAALIPILVHLFDRRRPRPIPFAPISFVLRSQRRTAYRLKLKRLLLYTLRTLILLAVPLALARPQFSRRDTHLSAAPGPKATAIILDASLSMRWSD